MLVHKISPAIDKKPTWGYIAITREFPAEVDTLKPEGGFFVWCRLPAGMSAAALMAQSEERVATFLAGTRCFANRQGDDAIRRAFSFQPAAQIVEGIARIGAAMRAI